MNFFQRQAESQRLSRLLVVLFVLAVLTVVAAVDSVVFVVVAAYRGQLATRSIPLWLVSNLDIVVISSLSVLGVILLSSVYRIAQLGGGGSVVAQSLGGMRISPDTTDPLQRRLLNVVEEMSIASSVPMPEVYLLEQESGINAFAAGHNPANAAIVVTRGALVTLNRSELQGVIAHEFSHVLNGDMRLNIRLMGLLFGLMVIALVARTLLRLSPRDRDSKSGGLVVFVFFAALIVMIIGYVGLFFGRLIQAAISRSREALADASAVQFTRDPSGLRGALVKIGAVAYGSHLINHKVDEVAHMLFAPGMSRFFETHPDLIDRIRELDPRFDEREFDAVRAQLKAGSTGADVHADHDDDRAHPPLQSPVNSGLIAGLVGNPGTDHVRLAGALRREAPPAVVAAARHPGSARALLLALALDPNSDGESRERQIRFVSQQLAPDIAAGVANLMDDVSTLTPEQRMPALLRAFPALRQLTAAERQQLLSCLSLMLHREGYMSLYGYALRKLAQVQLSDDLNPRVATRPLALKSVPNELCVLFSVLAHYGNADVKAASQAYAAGMSHLFQGQFPQYNLPVQWPALLDGALNGLDRLVPSAKELLVQALVKTISNDQQLAISEAELLRAVCGSLHCPLPPLLGVT